MFGESEKLTGSKRIDPLLIKAGWNIIHYSPVMIPANNHYLYQLNLI